MNLENLLTVGGTVSGQASPISVIDLIVALVISFLMGLWLGFVYSRTHRGMTYERSFIVTLTMIGPIIALVIMLIGSNLALSLGMVGALSIIRFRNVIKDSRDMVYLFWGIAIGLGAGTYNWNIVILASAFIGGVLFLLDYMKYGTPDHQDCVFVLTGNGESPEDSVFDVLAKHSILCNMRSAEIGETGWELVFEVRFQTTEAKVVSTILQDVRAIPGISNASLMAPHLALPI